MDKINFPYRSSSHLPFLHVVGESGSWGKHNLDVEYDRFISSEDAQNNVADGSVEFVGGNHVSPYAARTQGDQWLYLGQTVGLLDHSLVVREDSDINGVADLEGKVIATRGRHPGLNNWLFLKQNGLDEDNGDVKLEGIRDISVWEAVRAGQADAALVTPPADLFAQRAGMKVIVLDPLPMVWFTTMSSGRKFVDSNPEIVQRFLKATCEGIAYFKTHRVESIKIIQDRYKEEGDLDAETATHLWESIAKILLPKPYATFQSVGNVYELAKRQNKAAAEIEPMSLWDYHHLRQIDDSGFIDALYQT